MAEKFDVNQGHGNHNDCLFGSPGGDKPEMAEWICKIVPKSEICGRTENAIPCALGNGLPERLPFVLLTSDRGKVRLQMLVGVVEPGKHNTLISAYPECDGATVEVVLREIHEWSNGVEATLEGTMLGEGEDERRVAFFDTRYAMQKGKYVIGNRYRFKLAALCYEDGGILPPAERKIVVSGEQAERIYRALGQEPERGSDGVVKPWIADQSMGTAYWSSSDAYPDDAFFQSPVFERVGLTKAFDRRYFVFSIAIARSTLQEALEVRIPLYARSEIFATRPHKGDPIRGHMWLHGYLIDEVMNEAGVV